MHRLTALLLLGCLALLGTGSLEFLHDQEHLREDAAEAAAQQAAGGLPAPHSDHNDSNCPLHAQLHFPVALLITLPATLLLCLVLRLRNEPAPAARSAKPCVHKLARAPPPLLCLAHFYT